MNNVTLREKSRQAGEKLYGEGGRKDRCPLALLGSSDAFHGVVPLEVSYFHHFSCGPQR